MIRTAQLELIPATPDLLLAALAGRPALEAALGARVPGTWPHEYLTSTTLEFFLDRLQVGEQEGTVQLGWWLYFALLTRPAPRGTQRRLIGSAGYKGPPSADGTVEIGYGIVSDRRRHGYATEAVRGLIAHAFANAAVQRVTAHTLPVGMASIAVLDKCGFRCTGEVAGSQPPVLHFVLERPKAGSISTRL